MATIAHAHCAPRIQARFLELLPAVQNHAAFQFRHLLPVDREEAVAEATAAAFVTFTTAVRNGKSHRVTPSTLARYAALHVRNGQHVGGSKDRRTDVLSPSAQRRGRFRVLRLPDGNGDYNCLADPTAPVWGQVLLEDRRTPVAEQAAFRLDLSCFLSRQTGRTRTLLSLLAEGHRQTEIAERMGLTAAALCQRRKRAAREWERLQKAATPPGSTRHDASPRNPAALRANEDLAGEAPSGPHRVRSQRR